MDALALLQRLSARTGSGQRITALREQLGAGWKATLASGDQVVLGRGTTAELELGAFVASCWCGRRGRRRGLSVPTRVTAMALRYSATEDAFESAHELALARQEP